MKITKRRVDPIYTLLDFAKNPVFLLNKREKELEFDGILKVDGKVRTVIDGTFLLQNESDLFVAAVHLHKVQDDFASDSARFSGLRILKLMGWGTDGKSYQRLREAAFGLLKGNVRILDCFEDGATREGGTQLISDYAIWDKPKRNLHRPELDGSRRIISQTELDKTRLNEIALSRLILEKCRKGELKAVHPIYFELKKNAHAKRLFMLISVRASDLAKWTPRLTELRDSIPLNGVTYQKLGQVRSKLTKALDCLLEKGIIRKYEIIEGTLADDVRVAIYPNHEFFYSKDRKPFRENAELELYDVEDAPNEKPRPGKARTEKNEELKKLKHPLVMELISHGVGPKAAVHFVFDIENGEERVKTQLQYLNLKIKRDDIFKTSAAAFLVDGIKNDYAVPKALVKLAEEERIVKIRAKIREAEDLRYSQDPIILEAAIRKAQSLKEEIQEGELKDIAKQADAIISFCNNKIKVLKDPSVAAEAEAEVGEAFQKAKAFLRIA